jgi:hypothetical protein
MKIFRKIYSIFALLKKAIRISVSLTLAISILMAYAGVPVHSMICKMDGHTAYALIKANAGCEHEEKNTQKKSCCSESVEDECEKPSDDCCEFSTKVLKIEEPFTPSKSLQVALALPLVDIFFSEIFNFSVNQTYHFVQHNKAPPDIGLASHNLVFISVFRI